MELYYIWYSVVFTCCLCSALEHFSAFVGSTCLCVYVTHPSLHSHSYSSCRPSISDPGSLSAGGAANTGGWGLVRVSHFGPRYRQRWFSERHMDLPLHHRCSTAGLWWLMKDSFGWSSLALLLFRTVTAWSLAVTEGLGKLKCSPLK